uniref:uncharacterized protein LOC118146843 n=1 Tax=Callithrix jacchus TaxID=9483 RepID=UPI00159F5C30|nr:uncharacterized protein LOC118146843 [Callithrix jacchus]
MMEDSESISWLFSLRRQQPRLLYGGMQELSSCITVWDKYPGSLSCTKKIKDTDTSWKAQYTQVFMVHQSCAATGQPGGGQLLGTLLKQAGSHSVAEAGLQLTATLNSPSSNPPCSAFQSTSITGQSTTPRHYNINCLL